MSRTLAIAAALAAACLAAGCSGGSGDDTDKTVAPAAQNSQPAVHSQPDLRASMEAQLGFPPKPDTKAAEAYVADLKSIDPKLVAAHDPEVLVNRGRDQCRDLKTRPQKDWATVASQRFTTPQANAARIIKVVRERLCPTY
ncbi:hypothetical protein ACWT_5611 [Actinoplanes sp. SE50]|uniref:hypothetical protein n=1 Tax=unclassified Actinoplanes TaxID=2626549 RepID=UPI00023ECF2A|nr:MULTISPECIES: hypothetical protein [unclassified Actinoplanes]AEV86628.1 hypothetical protein ACPL_5741 [Actinoplanes sp. SE50/110]ATO85026.1 hypothetical protein ACWT_5611 [Actinoplanes sp. SE50]SLM02436.1 hypothetical protein ACSP50_5685 [Actinoplanes sp. SE50/110]